MTTNTTTHEGLRPSTASVRQMAIQPPKDRGEPALADPALEEFVAALHLRPPALTGWIVTSLWDAACRHLIRTPGIG